MSYISFFRARLPYESNKKKEEKEKKEHHYGQRLPGMSPEVNLKQQDVVRTCPLAAVTVLWHLQVLKHQVQ